MVQQAGSGSNTRQMPSGEADEPQWGTNGKQTGSTSTDQQPAQEKPPQDPVKTPPQ